MSKYSELKQWLSRIDSQAGELWLKIHTDPEDKRKSRVCLMATLPRVAREYTLVEFDRDPTDLLAEAKGEAITVGFPHLATPHTLLVYALGIPKYQRTLEDKLSIVFY